MHILPHGSCHPRALNSKVLCCVCGGKQFAPKTRLNWDLAGKKNGGRLKVFPWKKTGRTRAEGERIAPATMVGGPRRRRNFSGKALSNH